jgi:hypothetical protein
MKQKIDDISIEFIMASKSLNAFRTVMEVYKGHYGDYPLNKSLDALVEILSPIVQATLEVRLDKVLSEILPVNRWKSGIVGLPVDMPLNETIVRYLISEMNRLPKDKFFESADFPIDMSMKDVIIALILPRMKFLNKEHFFELETAVE